MLLCWCVQLSSLSCSWGIGGSWLAVSGLECLERESSTFNERDQEMTPRSTDHQRTNLLQTCTISGSHGAFRVGGSLGGQAAAFSVRPGSEDGRTAGHPQDGAADIAGLVG